jgi:hypothetical protein
LEKSKASFPQILEQVVGCAAYFTTAANRRTKPKLLPGMLVLLVQKQQTQQLPIRLVPVRQQWMLQLQNLSL